MIIFLDFDGVLHPSWLDQEGSGDLFCCLPHFHAILRASPGVEVVFSTSWRLMYPLSALVDMCCRGEPGLRERFVGMTPRVAPKGRFRESRGERQAEIELWLRNQKRAGESWIALDDCADFFRDPCDSLYLVDGWVGLQEEDVPGIVEVLRHP